jgi:hypothetical protein
MKNEEDWFDMPGGVRLRLCGFPAEIVRRLTSANNPPALSELLEMEQRAIDARKQGQQFSEDILDWQGVYDKDGNEVPYTEENKRKINWGVLFSGGSVDVNTEG